MILRQNFVATITTEIVEIGCLTSRLHRYFVHLLELLYSICGNFVVGQKFRESMHNNIIAINFCQNGKDHRILYVIIKNYQ